MVGGDPAQLLTIHLGAVVIHVIHRNQFTSTMMVMIDIK